MSQLDLLVYFSQYEVFRDLSRYVHELHISAPTDVFSKRSSDLDASTKSIASFGFSFPLKSSYTGTAEFPKVRSKLISDSTGLFKGLEHAFWYQLERKS